MWSTLKKTSIIYLKFLVPIIQIQGLFSNFKYPVFHQPLLKNYNIHVLKI